MKRYVWILLCLVLSLSFFGSVSAAGEGEFTLCAGKVEGKAGELVQVPLTVTGNPGVISIKVQVEYNAALLTLVEAREGDFKGVTFGPADTPFVVNWMDALQGNHTKGGVLAVLTFRLAENPSTTRLPITLSANPKDIFDFDFSLKPLTLQGGEVTLWGTEQPTPDTPTDVVWRQLGDVDENGAVNAKDALQVLKAAVGKITLTPFAARLADCNGDGLVNAKDALEILRYTVGKGYHLNQLIPLTL